MQTRTLVLGLIALSLIPFSAAFVFYDRSQNTADTTTQSATTDKTPLVRDYSPVIGPKNAPVRSLSSLIPPARAVGPCTPM